MKYVAWSACFRRQLVSVEIASRSFSRPQTRMQSLNPDPKARYSGISDAFLKMYKMEGAARPFRGMSIMVAGAGPAHAMYFACYEFMKRVISGTATGQNHPLAHAAAGCMATVFHDAVMTPADAVKQRLQMYNSPYRSARHAISDMWRKEGLRPFYRSYITQLSMNVPFQALHFVTYELIQDTCNKERVYNPALHMVSECRCKSRVSPNRYRPPAELRVRWRVR